MGNTCVCNKENFECLAKQFNNKMLSMLFKIFKKLSHSDCKNIGSVAAYYFDLEKGKARRIGFHDKVDSKDKTDKTKINDTSYLNYYWIEFEYKDEIYKISLFYKDMDHNTGNIHVLPGAFQIWKKYSVCKCICSAELLIKSKERKPFCECGWAPILDSPLFWKDRGNDEIINLFYDMFECFEIICGHRINSTEFYGDLVQWFQERGKIIKTEKHLNDKTSLKGGHYLNYALLKWIVTSDAFITTYETCFYKGIGFFTKYGANTAMEYKYSGGATEVGPNVYENGAWKMNYHKGEPYKMQSNDKEKMAEKNGR